jgi:methionyl-tRNA formyltransferase
LAADRRLRTVLCTSGGLPGALVLRRLLACEGIDVVGILHSSRVLHARHGWLRGAWAQLRLSGFAYALYLWMATDAADCVGHFCGRGSVRSLAAARGIPRLATRDINAQASRRFLAGRAADLLVSAFFNQKIGAAALASARLAAINIHPSLLPDLKGVDPVFFAMLRRAPRLGVSVHHMSGSLDAGNIVAQLPVPPATGASVLRTTAELFDQGARLLLAHLERIACGDLGTAQAEGGSYDSWPRPAEVRRLRRRGMRLYRLADLALPPGD